MCDAEFDHFEAIKEGYEAALPVFITKAAEDGMAALAALANRISPTRKGALAITNATLINGTGAAPVADAVVVIEGDRITAAGPRAQVKIPKGATVIDAKGKTVLPGLWDMHAHFEQVEWGPIYLAAGVTTVGCWQRVRFHQVGSRCDQDRARAWPAIAVGRHH